jgi:glucokinase
MSVWMGVDVGGTNIVCGAVDRDGGVVYSLKGPTQAHLGAAAVFDTIAAMARQVLENR